MALIYCQPIAAEIHDTCRRADVYKDAQLNSIFRPRSVKLKSELEIAEVKIDKLRVISCSGMANSSDLVPTYQLCTDSLASCSKLYCGSPTISA